MISGMALDKTLFARTAHQMGLPDWISTRNVERPLSDWESELRPTENWVSPRRPGLRFLPPQLRPHPPHLHLLHLQLIPGALRMSPNQERPLTSSKP
jgi:hypothetical protein